MQSRKHSFYESVANSVVGYLLALALQIIIWKVILEVDITLFENMGIALIFYAASFARSYCIRRFFVWWQYHDLPDFVMFADGRRNAKWSSSPKISPLIQLRQYVPFL